MAPGGFYIPFLVSIKQSDKQNKEVEQKKLLDLFLGCAVKRCVHEMIWHHK